MKKRYTAVLSLAVAFVCGACSGGGGGNTAAEFVAACTGTGLGQAVCECASRKAKEQLTEDSFAFLVATLQKDEDKTTALRQKLSVPELTGAGMFMVSGPAQCAKELAESEE